MAEFFATFRRQWTEFFGKMERGQIIRLVVLLVLIVAVAITAVVLLSRKNYSALPVSGDAAKMGEVNARLGEMGVQKKIGTDGSIMVPEDEVDSIVWQLASEGIFSDDFAYDWITQGSGFTATENMQNAYATIQAQENLRRMIRGYNKIEDAKVMLSIVKEPVFIVSGAGRQESSASVLVYLSDMENPLTAAEANVIRQIVRFAANIPDDNITVSDNLFNYYDASTADARKDIPFGDRIALQREVEDNISRALTKFFESVFGVGMVKVQATADLNFDRETVQTVVFAPPIEGMETGIPIAMKTLSETIRGGNDVVQGEPGLDENGGSISYVEETLAGSDAIYTKISNEVNYEINETKTMIERAEGNLIKLTVAVIIPMDEAAQDYTDDVRSLTAAAAGITPNVVEVRRMPIADPNADLIATYGEIEDKAQQYQMVRLLIIIGAIVLVVVLLLIALRTILKALRPEPVLATADGVEANEYAIDMAVGDEIVDLPPKEDLPIVQIQRFIERDPEAVAQLLRNWLTDDYR